MRAITSVAESFTCVSPRHYLALGRQINWA